MPISQVKLLQSPKGPAIAHSKSIEKLMKPVLGKKEERRLECKRSLFHIARSPTALNSVLDNRMASPTHISSKEES